MANKSISECYEAACSKHEIKTNPYILDVLQKMTGTGNTTLKLKGNNRHNLVQRISDNDVFVLSECLQNNQNVTGVDLSYNNVSDEGAAHLAALMMMENSALRSLDLTFNDIQKKGAEVLASSLEKNSSLCSLRLSGNRMGDRGALNLVHKLHINQTLQELQLDDCNLATSDVLAVCIMLKSNSTLRSVDISRPLLFSQQEEWAQSFSEMLAVNRSLVELHLGKMGLTDTGMERLAEGLKQNHSLRYLDLHCNRVACDGALRLAEVLKQNSCLEILDLSSNRIEDAGAVYLSEAITWPGCVLKELSVCRNNIRSKGLLSLSQALRNNSSLTHVYIWGNHLEESVCQAFRKLTSSGRLPPEQTDVSAYEVDGHVFLAEVNQSLRKYVYCADSSCLDSDSSLQTDTNTTNDASTP